jgi:hypothetical protein
MPKEINVNLTAGRRSLAFSDAVLKDYASVLSKGNIGKGYQWGDTLPADADKTTVTALRSEAQGLARRIEPVNGLGFTVRTVKGDNGSSTIALVAVAATQEG